jgi:oxygen-independent coproporphyrinogen-3 oxidase
MADGLPQTFPFSPAALERIRVSREEEMGETMMLGMRLVGEGVAQTTFQSRFGMSLGDAFGRQLRHLRALGLIAWDAEGTRLTAGGRLLGNRVFREFV